MSIGVLENVIQAAANEKVNADWLHTFFKEQADRSKQAIDSRFQDVDRALAAAAAASVQRDADGDAQSQRRVELCMLESNKHTERRFDEIVAVLAAMKDDSSAEYARLRSEMELSCEIVRDKAYRRVHELQVRYSRKSALVYDTARIRCIILITRSSLFSHK
jgi:hypothetical protein